MTAADPALSEFPYPVIAPGPVSLADAEQFREEIEERLVQTGAVLLRGVQCKGAAELAELARTLSRSELFSYAGGASPRQRRPGAESVYNSTDYPPDMPLLLHNELSYSTQFPKRLYFFCDIEPHTGGETTLGDGRRILAAMPKEITRELKTRGVRYIRNLTDEKGMGYSWQEAFETEDRKEVETTCRRIGAEHRWEANGRLRVSQASPAALFHPVTGEEAWFNQVAGFYADPGATPENVRPRLECTFADGGRIPPAMVGRIRAVLECNVVPHRWHRGDIVIVDNILATHGRLPFSGERRILLAMT